MRATTVLVLAIFLFPNYPATQARQAGGKASKKGHPLFSLAGAAGLPRYLKADPLALADAEGIRGGQVHTVDTDFVNKDFVFDIVVQFKEDDRVSSLSSRPGKVW